MDLAHLSSFVAVAEELHFSRAAARRHVSQPALSKQIRQLEAALGLTLFVRDRRTVQLTPEGGALLPRARAAVQAAGDVAAFADSLRRGIEGRLRIGFTPSAPHDVLPRLLRAFRARRPNVETQLIEASSRAQLTALTSGAVDVGILRLLETRPTGLRCYDLLREPFVVACPREHAIARRKRVRLRELANLPLVLVARQASPGVYDYLVESCRAAGFEPRVRQATQVHTALALVGGGAGVSLLPRSAMTLHHGAVAFRPLAEPLQSVLVLAHSTAHVSPPVAAFVDAAGHTRVGT